MKINKDAHKVEEPSLIAACVRAAFGEASYSLHTAPVMLTNRTGWRRRYWVIPVRPNFKGQTP